MIRVLLPGVSLVLAASLTGCVFPDEEEQYRAYDIQVDWSTTSPLEGTHHATITHEAETLEVIGYTGSVRAIGETFGETVFLCVNVVRRVIETYDGRDVPVLYPLGQQCERVGSRTRRVAFTF